MVNDAGPAGKPAKRAALSKREKDGESSSRKQLMEAEVLEHATRLFAQRGFAGTSLQDVANSMGLKRPALYYYFKSKDDLLDRLILEATVGPARKLEEIAARNDLDVVARLHASAHWIVEWTGTHTERFLLLVKSEADLSSASAKTFTEGRRRVLEAVKTIIDEGIDSGDFRPVDSRVAAFGVWGTCIWTAWWYQPNGAVSLTAIANQLADMAVSALQRPEHRGLTVLSPQDALTSLRENLDHLEGMLISGQAPGPRRY